MECGQVIYLKDINGNYARRFIAQCGGRFILISNSMSDWRNGYIMQDWRAVLRELVAAAQPPALGDHVCSAESAGDGNYHNVPLIWPLPVAELAGVLGVQAYEVREELAGLAVQAEL